MGTREEVLAAAARLVEVFGRHDTDGYFGCFDPEATFVFHTHPEPLCSRAAYERLWASWEAEDVGGLSEPSYPVVGHQAGQRASDRVEREERNRLVDRFVVEPQLGQRMPGA